MAISIGNFYSSGGKTVLGGSGGSGLDTESILKSLVEARQIPVKALEDKVTLNDNKNTALSEFKTLITAFKDASDLLRNVPGFAKQASNAFDYSKASVTSNTAVPASAYVNVSIAPGTLQQTHNITEITSVARAKKQDTGIFPIANADTAVVFNAPGAGYFKAGSVVIGDGTVTLAANDTLNQVAAKFNAVSGDTGISASVVKLQDNQFKLLFTATETGEDADFDLGPLADPEQVFDRITFTERQPASDAEFIMDGLTITRSTNTISDVIDGVTFDILQETPASTELAFSVTPDTAVAKNAIIGFINAYNDVKIFIAKQGRQEANGSYAKDAYLANNTMLRGAQNSISSEMSRLVDGLAMDGLKRLADIGITFTDLAETAEQPFVRNALTLNEATLDSALSSRFNDVRKVFEFTLTSDNANLSVFTRTNALAVSQFTLNINPATSTYQATYTDADGSHTVNLTATPFVSGGGYTLVGQAGTALSGLTLLYGSTVADNSISVNLSQGIADRLYNLTNEMLAADTGSISIEEEAIKTNTEKLQKDIERLNSQIETYREQLLARFAELEKTISQVNTLLSSIEANDNARNNS